MGINEKERNKGSITRGNVCFAELQHCSIGGVP